VCATPGRALCDRCAAELQAPAPLPALPGVDWFGSLFSYEGCGRQLIVNLKYRNARPALGLLAPALAHVLEGPLSNAPSPVTATWAPTTRARRRERGFDQAQLLTRAVAAQLGVPVARLLSRHGGPPQTGAPRRERLGRPQLVAPRPVPPAVLLIDDVRTSGSTLTAAAGALRARGAEWLIVGTLAQTPLNRTTRRAENRN
jgi:predicted amidophosphoribosyltransferase